VFLGLLPLVAVAGLIGLPSLVRLGRPETGHAEEHGLLDGIRIATGAAFLLGGLTYGASDRQPIAALALIAVGAAVGVPALRRVLPAGTFTARRGLPSVILSRGLLTFAFFGADAFVTLAITTARHGTRRSPASL
jgi:hypothetical protein